jgi:hypothetical protein
MLSRSRVTVSMKDHYPEVALRPGFRPARKRGTIREEAEAA